MYSYIYRAVHIFALCTYEYVSSVYLENNFQTLQAQQYVILKIKIKYIYTNCSEQKYLR
jgi:hypothetical protein